MIKAYWKCFNKKCNGKLNFKKHNKQDSKLGIKYICEKCGDIYVIPPQLIKKEELFIGR